MSKATRDLVFRAWTPESTATARRPSWMARRGASTRPPVPGSSAPSSAPGAAGPDEGALTREGGTNRDAVTPHDATPPASAVVESASAVGTAHPPLSAAVPPPPALDLLESAAVAELAEENASLRSKVADMAAAMAGLRRQVLEASEGELVNLALAIAERVVGRELATDPTLVVEWAREAIDQLAAKDEVVIAVAKDVAQRVPAQAWDVAGRDVRVQQDPALDPGVVEVRSPEGIVGAGVGARLGAVAAALGTGES